MRALDLSDRDASLPVASLRHHSDHGVTVALQVDGNAGVVDDSSDDMLAAALAGRAIAARR